MHNTMDVLSYFRIEKTRFFLFASSLFSVCLLSVKGQEALDDYFGTKNEALKEDVGQYLHALEAFDKTNSSFESLTTSIKHLFKYLEHTRQDELSSFLYAFPKLRPDLFPIVEERRISQKGSPVRISNVCIRRKDDLFFMIFPSRRGVEWMFENIKSGKGQIFYKGIPEPIKDLVVVQLTWPKSAKFKDNRTLTAEYRWGSLRDSKNVAILAQEFKTNDEKE